MSDDPTKLLEGPLEIGDNTQSADSAAELRAYFARKRSISVRSSLLLASVAILVAIRAPILGLDLVVGGACGVANMLLIMQNNERLLDGRRSRGVYGFNNVLRVLGIGIFPVLAALSGPWWSMGIVYAGFFTPLALYARDLRRSYRGT